MHLNLFAGPFPSLLVDDIIPWISFTSWLKLLFRVWCSMSFLSPRLWLILSEINSFIDIIFRHFLLLFFFCTAYFCAYDIFYIFWSSLPVFFVIFFFSPYRDDESLSMTLQCILRFAFCRIKFTSGSMTSHESITISYSYFSISQYIYFR